MARPARIDAHPDALFIAWQDGHESTYPNRYLRLMCGCANCVSEQTGQRLIREEDIRPDIAPTGIQRVGNYAIQIAWSDGHDTGIYSWDRLRELCPCPQCRT